VTVNHTIWIPPEAQPSPRRGKKRARALVFPVQVSPQPEQIVVGEGNDRSENQSR